MLYKVSDSVLRLPNFACFVLSHQSAIANHIGTDNRRKFSRYIIVGHCTPRCRASRIYPNC